MITRAHYAIGIALVGLLAGGCAAVRNAGRGTENVAATTGRKIDDASIHFAVKSALENDPLVRSSKIDVETKEGIVTLTGKVPNEAASKKAEAIAKSADGVHGVLNHLEVSSK